MKTNTKTKSAKKVKVGKFYVFVTMGVVIAALISLYASATELRVLDAEKSAIQALIDEENQKQMELNSRKHYYESDSYIEKIAREKLGLVKPNDVIFVDRNSK